MNFLEYLVHLFLWTWVLCILSYAFFFQQQLFLKLEHQVDAVRTSIALHHFFQSNHQVRLEHQRLSMQKNVCEINHVEVLKLRKSLVFHDCKAWMLDMDVQIWNANANIISHVLNCAPGKIILDKPIPKTFQAPFDWMISYPIELWVKDQQLYLKYHNNTQVWVSGFEYFKWNDNHGLEMILKWPSLPVIKWMIH
jgi:hypothetical protein